MAWADGTEPIENTADMIDSREIIARIEFLESIASDELSEDEESTYALDEEEQAELDTLRAVAEEGEANLADWPYGETLIRDTYFQTYAQELAEDIGAIDKDASWPNTYIDWERASEALLQDYTEIDFGGVTYWGRA